MVCGKINNQRETINDGESGYTSVSWTNNWNNDRNQKRAVKGWINLDRKLQILLILGVLLLVAGVLLCITRDPLLLSSGAVAALFMILLFRIDPLSPHE